MHNDCMVLIKILIFMLLKMKYLQVFSNSLGEIDNKQIAQWLLTLSDK